jgi:hypothetical protein
MMQALRAEGFFLCHTCRVRHPCTNAQNYRDKAAAHAGHSTSYLNRDWLHEQHRSRLAAWDPRQLIVSAFGWRDVLQLRMALEGYTANADVKQAQQAVQTMTVTNLHSKASSTTAGWQSAEVDNTSNLYLDTLVQIVLDFANTAPASSKCAYVFAASGLATTILSNPFSGTEGNLTLTDVTTTQQNAKLIGTLPYNTADEVVESTPMSLAAGNGGVHPPFWALGVMNHSGAALAASGNTAKYQGIYATVI